MATLKNKDSGSTAVQVSELGFEDGSKRFVNDDTGEVQWGCLPQTCIWRNNLTALSQRYNLYFVACGSQVYVYEPSFPFQILSSQPSLVLNPPLADPGGAGYIDRDIPHAINNLVIGDLGEEEIILLSCDSGNVAAYHTKVIFNEIKCRENDAIAIKHEGREVRSFFSYSVGMSAWGLAIHARARMIAISSNTKIITVFAFCLIDPQSDSESDDSIEEELFVTDASNWRTYNRADFPNFVGAAERRIHNILITLQGHDTNIPSVAFFNSDRDPDGRWLVSTDIAGQIRIWDIWLDSRRACLQAHDSWREKGFASLNDHDSYTRGWSLLCLDYRAFRRTGSISEALGVIPRKSNEDIRLPVDISDTIRSVPNASARFFPRNTREGGDDAMGDEESDIYDFIGDFAGPEDAQPFTGHNMNEEAGGPMMIEDDSISDEGSSAGSPNQRFEDPCTSFGPTSTPEDRDDGSEINSDGETSEDDDTYQDSSEAGSKIALKDVANSKGTLGRKASQGCASTSAIAGQVPAKPALFDSRSGRGTHQRHGQLKDNALTKPSVTAPPQLPFAILHTTAPDISLYDVALNPEPSVTCFRALAQELPTNLSWLHKMDRLNMAVQVPELGIVILATQAGRAVVLALTRLKGSNLLGFRLEWILPFKSQEDSGRRPPYPLLGMNVAPIQGREITNAAPGPEYSSEENRATSKGEKESWRGIEASRRYRLLMTYYDHTVLSYEISCNGCGNGQGSERVPEKTSRKQQQEGFLVL